MPNIILPWLGDHVDLPADLTAEQLALDLVRVGLEEEEIHSSGITGPLVVGRVLEMVPEEQKNGKVINWCQVDVGDHNVPNEDGVPTTPRGIVCGAHNFAVGDLVVVVLPGAVLPGPFEIAARKTYGHVSDGMICSEQELGLGGDHDGIIVLTRKGFAEQDLTPGQNVLPLLGLDEEILEINVTPDRGYCFSVRGVAREYAHSTGAKFTDHGIRTDLPQATESGFEVVVQDADSPLGAVGCDRFVTRIVRGIDATAPTPQWMVQRLEQAGMRAISLAVDITNYVMLDLGQPLHAYDLGTLSAPIVVRRATAGEKLITLDDQNRTLDPQDLLITDSPNGEQGARILGLAGVMGGQETEVTDATTDVLIEAAHFEQVTIARSARRHKLPSEAAKRFERGVDPLLAPVAAQKVAELLVEFGGGTIDEAVFDLNEVKAKPAIKFSLKDPERMVGVAYEEAHVVAILQEVGCVVTPIEGTSIVDVFAPTWRPDLVGPADLIEEVARLVGYDKIPSILPVAPAGRGLTTEQKARRSVARSLAESGFVEVLSYPFISAGQLDELRIEQDDARRVDVKLLNALQADKSHLRTNLLVTLLDTARRNTARGNTDIALFEMGMVTKPKAHAAPAPQLPPAVRPTPEELAALLAGVPDQPRHVAGVLCGQTQLAGWWGKGRNADWTDALAAAQLVAERVGVAIKVVADTAYAPYHPGRCARIELSDGQVVGHAGELHPKVIEELGLAPRAAAFELDLNLLVAQLDDTPYQATPVSTFPLGKEDLAFVVDESVTAEQLFDAVRDGAGPLLEDLRLFDVYVGDQIAQGKKSLAFSLRLRATDRTLTAADTEQVRANAIAEANKRVGAVLR